MSNLNNDPIEEAIKQVEVSEEAVKKQRFLSLGIPVDDVTPAEAVSKVVELIAGFKEDGRPRLVATLNVDFVVNSQGLSYSRPRHPELLQILRSADMVTADGFPIVMLGKIAGSSIEQRVTGADLVPALAERFAVEGLSMYLLGGADGSAQIAADKMVAANPGLQIAGISSPMIHTHGPGLVTAEEDDESIVNEINATGADLLLLGLGNPKQELWFQRNRHRLKVGVTIGVGGTFEFIAGNVKRAPEWMQTANLEWVYRITQDPKRLVRRYVTGLIKFGLLSLPLMAMRIKARVRRAVPQAAANITWRTVWGSRTQVLRTTAAPRTIGLAWMTELEYSIATLGEEPLVFIDCSKVVTIELAAQQKFYDLGKNFRTGEVGGALIGLNNRVRRSLKATRVLDAFDEKSLQLTPSAAFKGGPLKSGELRCQSFLLEKSTLVYLSGSVTRETMRGIALAEVIRDIVTKRDCIVDLRYANYVDAAGIVELYKLTVEQDKTGFQMFISGADQNIKRRISLLELPEPLNLINERFLLSILFDYMSSME